jgi:hypothetical protein
LLAQRNINVEDPLMVGMLEDLDKKSGLLDIDNSLFIPPTTNGDDSSNEGIVENLSNLIVKSINSNAKILVLCF